MKQLLKYYEKELRLTSEGLTAAVNDATDINKIICLTIKRDCYKIFVRQLRELVPAAKVENTEETDDSKARQEERDRLEAEKDARVMAMIMREDEKPAKIKIKGFEDFEPCEGQ